ncbi:glutathione S-transferase [Ramicandelaber brevisporus]|nr:glutathione S-transferase [Ramicandelaber brevisporus]
MPTQYELIYFDVVALGELSKALLSYSGVDWKLTLVSNWRDYKPQTPFGQVPVLREYDPVTGSLVVELAQSGAIEAYLATKFGLNGKTPVETALVHSICNAYYDYRELDMRFFFPPNEDAKEKAKIQLENFTKQMVKMHNKLIEQNPSKSGFYVGEEMTLADMKAWSIYKWSESTNNHIWYKEEEVPHLVNLIKKVEAHPKLQEYLNDFNVRWTATLKEEAEQAAKEAAKKAAAAATATAATAEKN